MPAPLLLSLEPGGNHLLAFSRGACVALRGVTPVVSGRCFWSRCRSDRTTFQREAPSAWAPGPVSVHSSVSCWPTLRGPARVSGAPVSLKCRPHSRPAGGRGTLEGLSATCAPWQRAHRTDGVFMRLSHRHPRFHLPPAPGTQLRAWHKAETQ